MANLPAYVLDQIDEIRNGTRTTLDLANHRLQTIPDVVFELPALENLILHSNNISEVPPRLRTLKRLRRIDLLYNPLKSVPDIPGLVLDWLNYAALRQSLSLENILGLYVTVDAQGVLPDLDLLIPTFERLPQLRGFGVMVNKPAVAPPQVNRLLTSIESRVDAEELMLMGIDYGEMPGFIRRMRHLRILRVVDAGLRSVPEWIGELTELKRLVLRFNELKALPGTLAELTQLEWLNALDNRFTAIPDVVFRVPSLEVLQFGGSKESIKVVPSDILNLPKLRMFELRADRVEVPPLEVVNRGVDAIKNFWRQQQETGTDYLAEAKLIIVGEPGAGKSSLARKILSRDYELQPSEPSTEGIEVTHWMFPAAIRQGDDVIKTNYRVNIWDFGGQEIYKTTHQFFLTRRSLYVLVADDRKEDTDFNYWLQIIEMLGDSSPIIIVQNEKQDRQRDVDVTALRARFPNIAGIYRVNLLTSRGLGELLAGIRRELESLRHIGQALPASWKRVRDVLEREPRPHLSLAAYLDLCEEHGFHRREDKLQLSDYLHQIGICLHFQHDPVLKNIVILRPKWGTDAVYRVLDNPGVRQNRGQFTDADLADIWSEETYAPMYDELLRLMINFQLCYELGHAYIAPQLLPAETPDYTWDPQDNLTFRYQYVFMPKGIMTRMIVALHHLKEDQSLMWRSGVILTREGTRAEIVEQRHRDAIAVRLVGRDTRALLAIIDDQLDRIHRSFPRLQCEKLLPCNCVVCATRAEPYMYALTELVDFAKTGDAIQCRISRKLVDAAALVRDLFPASLIGPVIAESRAAEPAAPAVGNREVFVSYSWAPESTAVVDDLERVLTAEGFRLIRDRNEVAYKDDIRDFMRRLAEGAAVILVISKPFLESQFCMFELTELSKSARNKAELRTRIFPIVMPDANISKPVERLRYARYWEREHKALEEAIKEGGGDVHHLGSVLSDLDLYASYRATIDALLDVLRDLNALTLEKHRKSEYRALVRALAVRNGASDRT